MTIRAVLFDVGGPLDTEVIHERLTDQHIREALAAESIPVSDQQYAAANRWAVDSFASNAYQAIIWRLAGYDPAAATRAYAALAARSDERRAARDGFELRPGIPDLLRGLHERGLALGLAANQPAGVIDHLDRYGIGAYFRHREVSGTHGYLKPDVRLFLRCCDDLAVEPADCIMVGDRIDNDIAPARLLGMRAILFRIGRHRDQQPRTWHEVPHATVDTVADLERAIMAMQALADDSIPPAGEARFGAE